MPPPSRVLIFHDRPDAYLPMLRARFPAVAFATCNHYDKAGAAMTEARADAVLAFKFEPRRFPREAFLDSPGLRWIHAGGAGIDHLLPWDPARVTVTNSSGIHVEAIAQYVMGALCGLESNLFRFAADQRERAWHFREPRLLSGRLMCVVGLGRIGRGVAARAAAFGMRVRGVSASARPDAAVQAAFPPDRLREALAGADVVVLCLPLTPATRGMVGAAELAALPRGAILVNVARGGILDEAALLAALNEGRLGAAVMDVFAQEPLPPDGPLWDAPNLLVTPHASSDAEGWQQRVALIFADNLDRLRQGEAPGNVVDPARGY